MNFVHIGAGAGDLDPSSNFRDGFSEYVKNLDCTKKNIFLIEANPKNIEKLKECWKDYKNAKIFNFAITPNNFLEKKINLFYSEEDGPHYQLLSSDRNHIKNYFPYSKIRQMAIDTMTIGVFLKKNFNNLTIESLSIDVEGLDCDIFMDINLYDFDINNISIEYLHLNKNQKKKIVKKFTSNGYAYNGFGVDHKNLDWAFTKKKSTWNNLVAKILPYIHRVHYKRLNKLIYKL